MVSYEILFQSNFDFNNWISPLSNCTAHFPAHVPLVFHTQNTALLPNSTPCFWQIVKGHFRVTVCLLFKTSLGANKTIQMIMNLICMKILHSFPFEWLCTRTCFENEANSNSRFVAAHHTKYSDSFYVKFSRTDKMYDFFSRICDLYSLFD